MYPLVSTIGIRYCIVLFFAVVWLCDVSARQRAGSDSVTYNFIRLRQRQYRIYMNLYIYIYILISVNLCEFLESQWNHESRNRLKDMLNCYDYDHYDLLIFVTLSTWKDIFEHFTELLLLKIPEVTELVASTIAGTFLARFGCLVSYPIGNSFWNVQFPCLDQEKASFFLCFSLCFCFWKNRVLQRSNLRYLSISDHSPSEIWEIRDYPASSTSFMIIPSPKSGEVSMSESTMESEHVDASGATPTEEYPKYLQCGMSEEDVKTLEACPFNAALAWRTLASFTRIFRDANLGGVLLPLVESLGLAQTLVSRWEGTLSRHGQSGTIEIWGQTNLKMDKMRYCTACISKRMMVCDFHGVPSMPISITSPSSPNGEHSPWSSANGPPCFCITLLIHAMEWVKGMEYNMTEWSWPQGRQIEPSSNFEHPSRLTTLLL